jgi:hypothetical protein
MLHWLFWLTGAAVWLAGGVLGTAWLLWLLIERICDWLDVSKRLVAAAVELQRNRSKYWPAK